MMLMQPLDIEPVVDRVLVQCGEDAACMARRALSLRNMNAYMQRGYFECMLDEGKSLYYKEESQDLCVRYIAKYLAKFSTCHDAY